jgi:dTDP-glucose 4,6-dehydratase
METMLVTGGAGFIGSNFVRFAAAHTADLLVIVDKLTYAGSLANLEGLDRGRLEFVRGDVADGALLRGLFAKWKPRRVVHLAAETHVDRSIDGPAAFFQTNVAGAFALLETAREYLADLADAERRAFRFLQVSTDEVYGSLGAAGSFTEESPFAPNSPYAASKAAADHLARAYHRTYGLPIVITHSSNNYGPYQLPDKLMPLAILNAAAGKPIPIYGDGRNVRDWLHVDDHAEGLLAALDRGRPGERYNLGGGNERTNLELVGAVCEALERELPAARNPALAARGIPRYDDLMEFVADRPGHDRRYAVDGAKAGRDLGWRPRLGFAEGVAATVRWYLEQRAWCQEAWTRCGTGRLGLGAEPSSRQPPAASRRSTP